MPVARVLVDVPLAHLDRPFDYAVPDEMSADAVPGARVRVRFAGRLVNGFILERIGASEHARLQPLQRVVSSVPVLSPEIASLARAVADRYAGTMSDVLRTAVPPRHARAEGQVLAEPAQPEPLADPPTPEAVTAWSIYTGGDAFLHRLTDGARGLRAVWDAAPGGGQGESGEWFSRLADLVAAAQPHGGVIIVAPDARDVARLDAALRERIGADAFVTLTAQLGPQRRYANFLRAATGRVRVVLGTRAAAFAPIVDPALLILWDDGDDSLDEPHAPYWHAREVLALRAHQSGASLLCGGFARSVETQAWIESGWAKPISPKREILRALAPRVTADDAHDEQGPARLPSRAWQIARTALESGPVLVQVSRRGYVPGLACQRCRTPARCLECAGPLSLPHAGGAPVCRWCATPAPHWRCSACDGDRLRAMSVGSARTAEELGRAFPGVRILASSGDHILDDVEGVGLVVATPGAEPHAESGYAAVLILDAHTHLSRAALRAGEETARRWFTAAAQARPGAPVVVTAPPGVPAVQALVRWDPAGYAARELAERVDLGLPPAVRCASIVGDPAAVSEVADALPESVRRLGPHDVPAQARAIMRLSDDAPARLSQLLVTAPRTDGAAMASSLREIQVQRSARKDPRALSIHLDPLTWGSDLA